MNDPVGMLPVDKPQGPTSHDVVARARRALAIRRIGHTGTLDPFASGLLILCIGNATRLAEYLASLQKTYTATLRLGAATDTDDRTGSVIAASNAWQSLERSALDDAIARQIGEIDQVPPAFSAKKVDGERLYRRARRGQVVTLTATRVTVHALRMTRFDPPDLDIEITCGTGTYIRAIARDIGYDLKCYAHLVELRRTRIGTHAVERAIALEQLDDPAVVAAAWIEPAAAVSHLPQVVVDSDLAIRLSHGMRVRAPGSAPGAAGVAVAVSAAGRLVAVAEIVDGWLRPRKVFS